MNDEGDTKQGISREGPLRSITSPPFSGSVAHVESGPLAHNHLDTKTGVSSHSGVGAAAPPARHMSPPSTPLGAAHPLTYQTQARAPPRDQVPPVARQQQTVFSGAGSSPPVKGATLLEPATRGAGGGGGVDNNSDPLSHFLSRPDGMQMERDAPHTYSASTSNQQQGGGDGGVGRSDGAAMGTPLRFDSTDDAAAAGIRAVLPPPPVAAEPVASASQGGSGDSTREADHGGGQGVFGISGETTSAKVPPMPALPPPPTRYNASKHYQQQQQQQQQRGFAPHPPAALSGLALPHQPPPPLQQQHQVPPSPPREKSLDTLVAEFLSSEAPPPPEPVSETLALGNPDGWVAALGQLARRRAWRKLVEIAGTMLVAHRGGGAPSLTIEQAMDLRLRRAMGMLKIGRAADAVEAAVEAGKEAGQSPLAAVSVAARVAAAGAKSLCEGEAEEEALDELIALKFELEEVIAAGDGPPPTTALAAPGDNGGGAASPTATTATAFAAMPASAIALAEAIAWRRRVISSLVNTLVRRGNWRTALGLLEDLGKELCGRSNDCLQHSTEAAMGEQRSAVAEALTKIPEKRGRADALRVELLSRIGRVFLQFGSLEDAEIYFRRAEEAAAAKEGVKEGNPRVLVNRGLLDFSRNEFLSAQENFRIAAEAAAAAAVKDPPDETDDVCFWATFDQGAGLVESAVNNLSLAMVYSCDVMRGVKTLEGLIRKDPRLYMLDVVIFNLCTLYDLSFDAIASAKKKRTLQAVAERFRLEDIDPSSFRMS